MTSPGKYLVLLATRLEEVLKDCGRQVDCTDLAYGSSVIPPMVLGDCGLKVDVGPDQNPFRAINLRDGSVMYKPTQGCVRGWRFNGVVRVTGPYVPDPADCCHEHTEFTYLFTNTLGIVSEAVATWLEEETDGESVQTEFVTSYNGAAVTVAINFSMRICMPSCDELREEEAQMMGEINGLKENH